jgi:threonine/homoserine/homoserine lactone efflux protein
MYEYVISALIFGLTAGLKPGPLGIVVIQQTLKYGLKSGIKASFAPIITDGPIILAVLILLTYLNEIELFISSISVIGGIYLLWLSLKILRTKEINLSKSLGNSKSLTTAIKVNFLSPYPYLFWFTVGGTYIALGTIAESTVFIVISIGTLVLSKMLVAWVASRFRKLLDGKVYLWVMRVLGVFLAVFGILLLNKGYNLVS